jgi:hypothetical protein
MTPDDVIAYARRAVTAKAQVDAIYFQARCSIRWTVWTQMEANWQACRSSPSNPA